MEKISIKVYSIIGSAYCVEAEDGEKVYSLIKKALDEKRAVELSFLNIEILTTAFLNSAVGKLYNDYSAEFLKDNMSVVDITRSGAIALKRVIDTAKLYFKDPEAMQKRINDILGH